MTISNRYHLLCGHSAKRKQAGTQLPKTKVHYVWCPDCGKAVRVVGKHKKSATCDLCLDAKPILMVRNR